MLETLVRLTLTYRSNFGRWNRCVTVLPEKLREGLADFFWFIVLLIGALSFSIYAFGKDKKGSGYLENDVWKCIPFAYDNRYHGPSNYCVNKQTGERWIIVVLPPQEKK